MQLKELLFGVSIEYVFGTTSVSIGNVTADSRQVEPNALFVAIRGEFHDGHSHIGDAVKKGAIAILCEELPKNQVEEIEKVTHRLVLSHLGREPKSYPFIKTMAKLT